MRGEKRFCLSNRNSFNKEVLSISEENLVFFIYRDVFRTLLNISDENIFLDAFSSILDVWQVSEYWSLRTYGYVKKYLRGISPEGNSPEGFSEGNLTGEMHQYGYSPSTKGIGLPP